MDWTPKVLLVECEAADALRDEICKSLDDRLNRYHGTAYGLNQGDYWPENYYFTWTSYILPQLIFQNPRVKVGAGKLQGADFQAKGLETAINRWIKDTDWRTHGKSMGFDFGMLYGVSITRPVPAPYTLNDKDDPPWRPQASRIDYRLFSMDPLASFGGEDARYMQHVSLEDRDRLLQRAKDSPEEEWNKKLIEKMANADLKALGLTKTKDIPERHQVAWREVWCPEINDHRPKDEDPDQYNGTIYTIPLHPSTEYDAEWLRPPRAFFGPRWGPYSIYGAYIVPGCPYPLAPLVAGEAQFQEVNAQALALYKAARARKRIAVFDEAMAGDAEKISKALDGSAVGIGGLDKNKWLEMEIGGITDQQLAQFELARKGAERVLGLNDVQRGEIATGALATEVMEAQAASNVRTSDLKVQYEAGVKRELMTVAWYMWHTDKVVIPFTREEQAQIAQQFPREIAAIAEKKGIPLDQAIPKYWSGKDNVGPFDSLELNIEPYSMQRVDEPMMQARAMQAIQLSMPILQFIAAAPQFAPGMKKLLQKLGDAMNWPDFGEIIPDDIAAQMGAPAQLGQPNLAGDVGAKPATPATNGSPGKAMGGYANRMNGGAPK